MALLRKPPNPRVDAFPLLRAENRLINAARKAGHFANELLDRKDGSHV
jgi:hypothetical protein